MARITRARLDARHSWGLPYLLVVPIVLPSLPSCLSAALFAPLAAPLFLPSPLLLPLACRVCQQEQGQEEGRGYKTLQIADLQQGKIAYFPCFSISLGQHCCPTMLYHTLSSKVWLCRVCRFQHADYPGGINFAESAECPTPSLAVPSSDPFGSTGSTAASDLRGRSDLQHAGHQCRDAADCPAT